jgi:hypothetical protein
MFEFLLYALHLVNQFGLNIHWLLQPFVEAINLDSETAISIEYTFQFDMSIK